MWCERPTDALHRLYAVQPGLEGAAAATPAQLRRRPASAGRPDDLASLPIPDEPALPPSVPFPPGEAEAQRRLRLRRRGTAAIRRYADDRNRMDLDGTSQLSPYLRFGMISARRAVVAALHAHGGCSPMSRRAAARRPGSTS